MTIGENLRQLRLQKGLTQEQAAAKLHITRQALSSYESQRTQPDIHMLLALAEVYETDLDGILYGQETSLKNLRRLRNFPLGGQSRRPLQRHSLFPVVADDSVRPQNIPILRESPANSQLPNGPM